MEGQSSLCFMAIKRVKVHTDLADLRLSHNDVVNNDSWPPSSVATLAPMEDEMSAANGIAGDVFAYETDRHSPLLPEDPVLVLEVMGKHWRVVTHLDVYQCRYMYMSI